MKKCSRAVFAIACFLLPFHWGFAQQAPDTILFNGKVVTVDNHEVNGKLGTIAQAIAIRDGKILAVGTNAEVRRLADAKTKSLDLQGRMVTPGFGATHDHPQDWNPLNPTIIKKVISDDMHIERFINLPQQEALQQFPRVLEEAVQKAKPGMWIRISMLYGPEYRYGNVANLLGRQINKQMLDLAAPKNPVIVRAGFTNMLINQAGIEATEKFYGDQNEKFIFKPLADLPGMGGGVYSTKSPGTCGVCYRYPEQDIIYTTEQFAEISRLGLAWTAALGVTLTSSSFYTSGVMRAYTLLDRRGQLPVRYAWGWYWPFRNDFFQDKYLTESVVSREGLGSDYLWFSGMTPHMGMECSTLPGTSPEVKAAERACNFTDPNINRALYEYIKAGGKLAGDHQLADVEVDTVLDTIERASKDAGLDAQDIVSKRHSLEHMAMYPRPDQVPRFKKLGIIASGWNFFIWEGGGTRVQKNYGERGANMVIPRRSLYDAGVINTVEIDRPIAEYTNLTYFHVLYGGITRKDRDGNVTAPQQAISREEMLKSATLFAAYGVKKDKVLGSIETGKFADLIVLDKDYLTVPVDEILKIHVLMTMVGGKMIHLAPSLAREWSLKPAGPQVEMGGPASQW